MAGCVTKPKKKQPAHKPNGFGKTVCGKTKRNASDKQVGGDGGGRRCPSDTLYVIDLAKAEHTPPQQPKKIALVFNV